MEIFDPASHTVDDVNSYLAGVDDEERFRVLQAEQVGRARKGILEGPFSTAPPSVEELLAEVRAMSTNADQQPVEVTESRFSTPAEETTTVQPVVPVDGGDGTRTTRETKEDDNVWRPAFPPESFQPPTGPPNYIWSGGAWVTAAYNAESSTTNDTADLAGDALTKF